MEPKQAVLEAMQKAGKPLRVGQIIELTGLNKKEVDKIMKLLKKEELIISLKKSYWISK